MAKANYTPIEKEFIVNLRWTNEEHHTMEERHDSLIEKIISACILGNTEKHKCIIKFKTGSKKYLTETTIWSYCRETIVLKYGITIPLNKIEDVII